MKILHLLLFVNSLWQPSAFHHLFTHTVYEKEEGDDDSRLQKKRTEEMMKQDEEDINADSAVAHQQPQMQEHKGKFYKRNSI